MTSVFIDIPGFFMNVLGERVQKRISLKRHSTGKGSIHEYAQGINVRPLIDRQSIALLRAHVQRAADARTGGGEGLLFLSHFGQTEIDELDLHEAASIINQHYVGRFDIAVQHAQGMGILKSIANLTKNRDS